MQSMRFCPLKEKLFTNNKCNQRSSRGLSPTNERRIRIITTTTIINYYPLTTSVLINMRITIYVMQPELQGGSFWERIFSRIPVKIHSLLLTNLLQPKSEFKYCCCQCIRISELGGLKLAAIFVVAHLPPSLFANEFINPWP